MFLSFIVPVYNAQTYIGECLDSLLAQDITDYEIICVNDGSKDLSLEILQKYASKYPNIVIVDKENGGVTTARNAGLDAAQGDYIWFVDADDFVKENILAKLKSTALSGRCDRVVFGAYLFTDALTEEEKQASAQNKLPSNASWYDAVVWRSLLRRDFLKANRLFFRYLELTHGEDGLFMYEVALCQPSMAEIDEVLYFYREHSGSADTTVTPENRMRKIRSYIRIVEILQNHLKAMDNPSDGAANKLFNFLWMALYEISKFPGKQAREMTKELKKYGLYPCRLSPLCNMTTSYMTDRTDLVGKIFDKVYIHLHTRWGYHTMRLLHKLMGFLK